VRAAEGENSESHSDQGIVRDQKAEEQPRDRAQAVHTTGPRQFCFQGKDARREMGASSLISVPLKSPPMSGGMAWIEISRGLFLSLRHHLCWVWFSRHASRPELFPLLIILGLTGLSVVHLPVNPGALVIDLPAGFPFRSGRSGVWLGHVVFPLYGTYNHGVKS
jgi:hypothetical protein